MSASFTPTFAERLAVNFVLKMTKLATGEDNVLYVETENSVYRIAIRDQPMNTAASA